MNRAQHLGIFLLGLIATSVGYANTCKKNYESLNAELRVFYKSPEQPLYDGAKQVGGVRGKFVRSLFGNKPAEYFFVAQGKEAPIHWFVTEFIVPAAAPNYRTYRFVIYQDQLKALFDLTSHTLNSTASELFVKNFPSEVHINLMWRWTAEYKRYHRMENLAAYQPASNESFIFQVFVDKNPNCSNVRPQ